MKESKLERNTRRTFLKNLLLVSTGTLAAGFLADKSYEMRRPAEDKEETAVSVFSDEIYYAATRIVKKCDIINSDYDYFGSAFLGLMIAEEHMGEIESSGKSAGAMVSFAGLGCLVNRMVDITTTRNCFSLVNDPRMREYGLKKYFGEGNPFFKVHAKKENFAGLKSFLMSSSMILLGCLYYPIGIAITYTTPSIYSNNVNAYKRMEACLKIGDNVKKLIEHGWDKKRIKSYLYKIGRKNKKKN